MGLLEYLASRQEQLLSQVLVHLELTGISLGYALVVGVLLGILCHFSRWLSLPVLTLVSVIYTIPTLALFGLMMPFLGIGTTPAIAALFLYSLLPIVQNTYSGLANVPRQISESGRGIGMGRLRLLLQVELPLAVPVILGGIRVATVNVIGMVTLASLVGAGGLGDTVFRGIASVSMTIVIVGSAPVIIMALIADRILRTLERRLGARLRVEGGTGA